jgi:hypothetical protein
MTSTPPQSVPQTVLPAPPNLDRELLTYLREEAAANRSALRDEAEANRKLFSDTLKVAAVPLTAIIFVSGFFGWKSISDLRQSVQDEAKRQTETEVHRMQEEIRGKLNAEFETPQLQKTVREAASAQTDAVLRPLIQKEVSTNVTRSVASQQATINSTIVSETHKAVVDLKPTIDSIVGARVNSTVDASVNKTVDSKVQPVMDRLAAEQEMTVLLVQADSGDALAFDKMVELGRNNSTPKPLQHAMNEGAREIIDRYNTIGGLSIGSNWFPSNSYRFYVTENGKIKTEEAVAFVPHLKDVNSFNREEALQVLSDDDIRKNLDTVFQMMLHDPRISVRVRAYERFNRLLGPDLGKNHVDYLDSAQAIRWYTEHRQEMIDGKQF